MQAVPKRGSGGVIRYLEKFQNSPIFFLEGVPQRLVHSLVANHQEKVAWMRITRHMDVIFSFMANARDVSNFSPRVTSVQ